MAQLFISYSRSDKPVLSSLLLAIRRVYGQGCLWYDEAITGGKDWWRIIVEEIEKCEVFIYLVSDESLESDYCQKELREAFRLNKQILPVIVRRLKADYPSCLPDDLAKILSSKQNIDLSSGLTETVWQDIFGSIHALLVPQPSHSSRDIPKSTPDETAPSQNSESGREHIKLSRKERWILSNQFAILAKLYPDEADGYELMREAIERGYELHYNWISDYIYDGEDVMTKEECREVLDILDMFSFLKYAYESISDKSGIDKIWLKFHGFDGNTESKYLGYVHFLVEREEKFTWLERGDDFNSHMPILNIYRQMLVEWNQSRDKHNLSRDDVIRITSSPSRNRDS